MSDFEYFEKIELLLDMMVKNLQKKGKKPKVQEALNEFKFLKNETTKRVLNAKAE